ncbi:hypothetical protein sos41_38330 [Alphaproteobacteria bacterium SO-S41]|nr:hypothetical protein sos41_38330 [Alphaproteobacteria bacterium SO-S41]
MPQSSISTRGLNHVALVCSDMSRTVKFWEDLGIPLLKMKGMPDGGQHSFHNVGNGAMLAYMSFPGGPPAAPGIASQHHDVRKDGAATAVASMNHIAFDLPAETFDTMLANLRSRDIKVRVINHGSAAPFAEKPDGETWIRSMYFRDPDGIAFEFASLMRPLGTPDDLVTPSKNAKGEPVDYVPLLMRQ